MIWKFQKPWPKTRGSIHIGCLNCSPVTYRLSMSRLMAVGFGDVHAWKDNELLYSEVEFMHNPEVQEGFLDFPKAQEFEDMALKDPDHDWRIRFHAPLHEETYQRQGVGLWVMIHSGPGFA